MIWTADDYTCRHAPEVYALYFQNICKILIQCVDSISSLARKAKIISNLRQLSSFLTSWETAGYKDTEKIPLG